jgi:DNA-binding transcriptional LysR family regulator
MAWSKDMFGSHGLNDVRRVADLTASVDWKNLARCEKNIKALKNSHLGIKNMVKFTLKQCAYFRAVADTGGISQAARRLNISQPSISQAIDKLETLTGLTLFERHHAKGLTLTVQGRLFLEHVAHLESAAERVRNEAEALALEIAGEIRLGVFHTLAPFFLPKLISGFQKQMPKVTIRPSEMSLAELDDALNAGRIDLALTYDLGNQPDGRASVNLAAITPRAFVPTQHRLAGKDQVSVSELRDEAYVMLDGPGSRYYFDQLLSELGLSPQIAYASTSIETVRSAVASGLGYTFLAMQPPSSSTYDGGQLKALDIDPKPTELQIILVGKQDGYEGKIIKAFRHHTVKCFEQF